MSESFPLNSQSVWEQYDIAVMGDRVSLGPQVVSPSIRSPTMEPGLRMSGLTQTPTPLITHNSSPVQGTLHVPGDDDVISVSTSFYPGSHPVGSDVILSSADNVVFYVHSQIITASSPNAFAAYLSPTFRAQGKLQGNFASIPDVSSILNIILHALYESSSASNSPTFEELCIAVDRMPHYGISPKRHIAPNAPLYFQLLAFAPLQAIELYALAGRHDLQEVAEKASSHLLGFPLPTIKDELAMRMGPVYLKRLFLMHANRLAALKDLLLQPPQPHTPTSSCTIGNQRNLGRAWALAAAYLVWDARPDLSTHIICTTFDPLIDGMSCSECQVAAKTKVRDIVVKWAAMKCTI